MLAQSLINFWIDKARPYLKPIRFNITEIPNPKEFLCMGFKLSDLDVKVKKGYIQADVGYEEVTEDKKNLTFCD